MIPLSRGHNRFNRMSQYRRPPAEAGAGAACRWSRVSGHLETGPSHSTASSASPASPSYFLAAAASQQYCTAASSQQPDIAQWLLVPANWGQETGDVASYLNCRLGRAKLLAAAVMLGTALDH